MPEAGTRAHIAEAAFDMARNTAGREVFRIEGVTRRPPRSGALAPFRSIWSGRSNITRIAIPTIPKVTAKDSAMIRNATPPSGEL